MEIVSNVKIITDSSADLPDELARTHGIAVVPLMVRFPDGQYLDGVDITREEFYSKLAESPELPRTSQPSPEQFLGAFRQAVQEGADHIICPLIPSVLSGTAQSAFLAKELFEKEMGKAGATGQRVRMDVIPTRATSMGLGLIAILAARMAQAKASGDEVVAKVRDLNARMNCIFTVDTLEYLAKGGRISKAKALLGSLLNLKPVLYLDEEGAVAPLDKVRGRKKAIRRLLEIAERDGVDLGNQVMAVSYSGSSPDEALELVEAVKEQFRPKEVLLGVIGATIGTHVGPGTLALFFLS